jgi:hypothetical protein
MIEFIPAALTFPECPMERSPAHPGQPSCFGITDFLDFLTQLED